MAHQWFGDLVTETHGTHHWLQEGGFKHDSTDHWLRERGFKHTSTDHWIRNCVNLYIDIYNDVRAPAEKEWRFRS